MIGVVSTHVLNKIILVITKLFLSFIFNRNSNWVLTRNLRKMCVTNFAREGGTALNYYRTIDILCSVKYVVQAQCTRQFATTQ
jgi:hypothetical protein